MPNKIRNDIHKVDAISYPYIYEENVSIPLKITEGLVRCNIYRPKPEGQYPVFVTYGPYGKDVPYKDFHPQSFSELNPSHKSVHSCWETPDPEFWTAHGYAIVRADELGAGQSPGFLDTMSRPTSEAFCEVIEWAATQPWSTGKVGLLGISYYAGSQWRVAARQPKGLAAMIPWEGMSDYYRDRCRHGGILSNVFIKWWWDRQVVSNQYGRPGRAARNWGPDTIEGDLEEDEMAANRADQTVDTRKYKFRDEEYFASREFDLADIKVPLLSVANWGGILLHLRGNVEGFVHAGSELKYLRFITGRHDLPFFYEEEVEIQRSFLDAFLKGDDRVGWSVPSKVPPVDLVLRKGNVGYNDANAEKQYKRRQEVSWPIERTRFTRFHLHPDNSLSEKEPSLEVPSKVTYEALGSLENPQLVQFVTAPFAEETEITGNIVARLSVSMTALPGGTTPKDIDLFVTLRYIDVDGKEVFYTGTTGDPVPLTKGWLRVSFRKVDTEHHKHRPYLPWRTYYSTDVLPVIPAEVYTVDIEVWPTNVVVEKGARLCFEVASGDTQGCGIFGHNDAVDRAVDTFKGLNHICFGSKFDNYVVFPIIPTP